MKYSTSSFGNSQKGVTAGSFLLACIYRKHYGTKWQAVDVVMYDLLEERF
jgi:hypothetical protein